VLLSLLPGTDTEYSPQIRVSVKVAVSLRVSDTGRNLGVSALVLADLVVVTAGVGDGRQVLIIILNKFGNIRVSLDIGCCFVFGQRLATVGAAVLLDAVDGVVALGSIQVALT
jgi:hypothetical protein